MSYTVVHDQQYEERRFENLCNEVKRHCKIGKVKIKNVPRPDPITPMWPATARPWWDDPFRPTWQPSGTGYVNPHTTWIS